LVQLRRRELLAQEERAAGGRGEIGGRERSRPVARFEKRRPRTVDDVYRLALTPPDRRCAPFPPRGASALGQPCGAHAAALCLTLCATVTCGPACAGRI